MVHRRILLISSLLVLTLAGTGTRAADRFAEVEIQTTALSAGLFMLTGAGGNMGLSVGQDGAFLIDDEFAPLTERIIAAIGEVTDKPVDFVLNTHYHGDHTGGNENLGQTGSHLVGHANVRRRLAADQKSALLGTTAEAAAPGALPTITFTDSLSFFYNDQEIIAFHVPHAHTDGDAVVHFPRANVVHAGDVVFLGLYPYIDTAAGGSIDGMIAGVRRIVSLCDDRTQVIPGHGPLGDKKQLEEYLAMLTQARANVAAEMAKGHDLAAVQAAAPCARWDEALGQAWLTSDQFVQSIFDSLTQAHAGHTH